MQYSLHSAMFTQKEQFFLISKNLIWYKYENNFVPNNIVPYFKNDTKSNFQIGEKFSKNRKKFICLKK